VEAFYGSAIITGALLAVLMAVLIRTVITWKADETPSQKMSKTCQEIIESQHMTLDDLTEQIRDLQTNKTPFMVPDMVPDIVSDWPPE